MVFVPNPDDLGVDLDDVLSPRLLAERAISARVQEFTAVLGQPVSELIESIEGGFVQHYEFGSMYWRNREIGAKCVYGAIHQHYQTLGAEHSYLGFQPLIREGKCLVLKEALYMLLVMSLFSMYQMLVTSELG